MTVLNSMITFLIVVSGVLTFLACYIESIQNTVKEATESILLYRLQAAKGRYFNYDRIATFIEENGVAYMLSNSINPVMYIVFKGLVGIVFGTLIGVSIELPIIQKIAVFILCFVIGFFGIDVIVKNNNENANQKMMLDISNTYDVLKIQVRAGVYITDSIFFCYQNCSNKRLKDALLAAYLDIKTDGNIERALEKLNAKFNNRQISTLCAILEQSLTSGQSAEILDNITKKNVDVQKLINQQYRRKIEKIYNTLGILIVIGLFAVVFYIAGVTLKSVLLQF